ncbi:MAG TPA: D-glucuronyl C5-epimerase family protein [Solirubrobacteraceae bacterium]|nr:D-glucuronyl C5-epimerase family protein [Solirubrobacteraceae bacterium]
MLLAPTAAHGATKKRTVKSELTRLAASGAITAAERDERLAAFNAAKRSAKRLPRGTTRKNELTGVVSGVEGIAARRTLTGPRLVPLWLTLERNRAYWTTNLSGPRTRRISFPGSELVWQYFPGQGLQFHPLANFAKLNQLWAERSDAMGTLLDELLALRVPRAGGVAWEYYFSFGGGNPPWVSGLAQGTGIQSIARVAQRTGRKDEVLPIARQALGVFKTPTPEGVRVAAPDGAEYALYSFAPKLSVINGFVQALVGLYDLGKIGGDADAQALYADGERVARRALPTFDTGAWSLYSRGSSEHESDLSYHQLLRAFLRSMCTRTEDPVYCDTELRFAQYELEEPQVSLVTARLRGGTSGKVRVRLSKISRVGLRFSRGGTVVSTRAAVVVGHGRPTLGWTVPRKAGAYDVTVTAVDLAGNVGTAEGTIEVLKPKRKRTR